MGRITWIPTYTTVLDRKRVTRAATPLIAQMCAGTNTAVSPLRSFNECNSRSDASTSVPPIVDAGAAQQSRGSEAADIVIMNDESDGVSDSQGKDVAADGHEAVDRMSVRRSLAGVVLRHLLVVCSIG